MSKTVPVMSLIAILIAFEGEIESTWLTNGGHQTEAGIDACNQINHEIEKLMVYDRVSFKYMCEMTDRLEKVYVHCFQEMEAVFHQVRHI